MKFLEIFFKNINCPDAKLTLKINFSGTKYVCQRSCIGNADSLEKTKKSFVNVRLSIRVLDTVNLCDYGNTI